MTVRRPPFERNEALERLLEELNRLLAPAEQAAIDPEGRPRLPVVFVAGSPRSGTTLLMQWLAASGRFACPTNLLSRFHGAPYIGALVQQLLCDPAYRFRDEIPRLETAIDFASDLGKTRGLLAPNEFWYFWRRFLPNREPRPLSSEEEARIDGRGLLAELGALERAFGRPLAFKAMLFQFNLPAVSSLFEAALFLHVRRDLLYNAQSLLEARLRYSGDRETWYSAKPPEYPELKRLTPERQVAGQVHHTNRAIEAGLRRLDPGRVLRVRYEDFCRDPEALHHRLAAALDRQGLRMEPSYQGPRRFELRAARRLPEEELARLITACEELEPPRSG